MTTQQMTGRTMSMTLGSVQQPSRAALATRSLRAAERLRDEGRADDYRAALAQHFAEFVTPPRRSCLVRSA